MKTLGRVRTVAETARDLGVSRSQLDKAIKRGELRVMRHTSGRVMGVYEGHAVAWQQARLSAPTRPPVSGVDARMQDLIRQMEAR